MTLSLKKLKLVGTIKASLNVTVKSPAWDIVVIVAVRVSEVPLVMILETMTGRLLVLLLLLLFKLLRVLKFEELDDEEF